MVYEQTSQVGGGDQLATRLWVRNLLRHGIEVKLLTDKKGPTNFEEFPQKIYLTIQAVTLWKLLPAYSLSLFLTKKVKNELMEFQPDVIHIEQQLPFSYQVLGFAKRQHIPILSSFHTAAKEFVIKKFPLSLFVRKHGIYNKLIDIFQSKMLAESDAITIPSQQYKKTIAEKIKKPLYILSSPVANHFFQKIPKHEGVPKKLISVSRLSSEKRVEILISMMQYLKDKFTLTLVGDGVDRQFFEKRVSELGLSENITFQGRVDNEKLLTLYREHDLYVSASDFETFGMTYVEALGSRLPCVVYDYPVSREVIPNDMAVFVPTLDPKDWADALTKLQSTIKLYNQLSDAIEKKYSEIEKYNEEESTKKLIEIYNTLLRK